MKRRHFLRNTSLALAGLAFPGKKPWAALRINNPWNINMLTDDIGIFTEKGGTMGFLLSKKGIVVIDSQFPDTAPHLIDELKKRNEEPFHLLINTHHHGDHTSGNIAFKGLVNHVLAHENSKANQERVAKEQKKEESQLYPDIVYDSAGWSGEVGNEKIHNYYFGPAHTNGDSLVHFEHANIIHLGDLVFNRRHPYIDKTAGADISNWIKVLAKTTATFDKYTKYICGHSGNGYQTILQSSDLDAFADYLGNLLKFVGAEIKAGKPKEEILKAPLIPGSPEWSGTGIDRPINAAYQELTSL